MSRRRHLSPGRPSLPNGYERVESGHEDKKHSHLGVLPDEEHRLRKDAFKAAKAVFKSYKADTDVRALNVGLSTEWEVDTKMNLLHIPFKIETIPNVGMFQEFFKLSLNDPRAKVEYDGDDRFYLALDWERLLNRVETSPLRRWLLSHRTEFVAAVGLLLLLAWYWIWVNL